MKKSLPLIAGLLQGGITFISGNVIEYQNNNLSHSLMSMRQENNLNHTDELEQFNEYDMVEYSSVKHKDIIEKLAILSRASYNNLERIDNTFVNSERSVLVESGKEIFSFSSKIPGKSSLPAGILTYEEQENGPALISIAFHGTECNADAQTDLWAFKDNLKELKLNGHAHGGFLSRYLQSRESLFDAIESILHTYNKTIEDCNFDVTGHSLGGALANLAAVDIKKNLALSSKVNLVTFSAPRVFDHKSAFQAKQILKDSLVLRIWRKNDLVPAVSLGTTIFWGFLTGFKHIGEDICLKPKTFIPSLENHSLEIIINEIFSPNGLETFAHVGFNDWIYQNLNNLAYQTLNSPMYKVVNDYASNMLNTQTYKALDYSKITAYFSSYNITNQPKVVSKPIEYIDSHTETKKPTQSLQLTKYFNTHPTYQSTQKTFNTFKYFGSHTWSNHNILNNLLKISKIVK